MHLMSSCLGFPAVRPVSGLRPSIRLLEAGGEPLWHNGAEQRCSQVSSKSVGQHSCVAVVPGWAAVLSRSPDLLVISRLTPKWALFSRN